MFPISLQPNRADRQQNRACLCPARRSSPEICICPPPHHPPLLLPIQFSSSTRLRKRRRRAERRGQINQRPTPNYCCPNSYTRTMTEAWDWRADQRDDFFFLFFFFFLSPPPSFSLQRQWTQMAIARARDQILWKAPNG